VDKVLSDLRIPDENSRLLIQAATGLAAQMKAKRTLQKGALTIHASIKFCFSQNCSPVGI